MTQVHKCSHSHPIWLLSTDKNTIITRQLNDHHIAKTSPRLSQSLSQLKMESSKVKHNKIRLKIQNGPPFSQLKYQQWWAYSKVHISASKNAFRVQFPFNNIVKWENFKSFQIIHPLDSFSYWVIGKSEHRDVDWTWEFYGDPLWL